MLVRFSEIVWDLDEPDFDELGGSEVEKELRDQEWLGNQVGLPPTSCVLDVGDDVDVADIQRIIYGAGQLKAEELILHQVIQQELAAQIAAQHGFTVDPRSLAARFQEHDDKTSGLKG
jgi:hypothetical protein